MTFDWLESQPRPIEMIGWKIVVILLIAIIFLQEIV